MGTTQTLVPNLAPSGGGSWPATGGTVVAVLSDTSNSTYVALAGGAQLWLEMSSYTIPTGYQINRLRAGLTFTNVSGGAKKFTWALSNGPGQPTLSASTTQSWKGSAYSNYTAWTAWTAPNGVMAQAEVDALRTMLSGVQAASGAFTASKLWIELDVIDQPTVTVSTPATGTSRPWISWTYADGDGDPQAVYRVKVFDSATYSGGGFSPDTSTPIWDSGLTYSDAATVQTGALTNGAYRAYVLVGHAVAGSGYYYSAWAYAGWTVAVTPPTVPTLALSWLTGSQAVQVVATGAALAGGYTTQTFEIQSSADNGATWADARGAVAAVPNGSYQVTVIDYEATRGVSMQYRVRAAALDSGGLPVISAWSSASSQATTNDGTWWLKVVSNPALNMGSVPIDYDPAITIDETLGVFTPLGATKKTVVGADEYGEDGTYEVHAQSAQMAAVAALAKVQTPLLAQDPWGGQKYIRWIGRSRTIAGLTPAPRSPWTLNYVEVDRPAVT